MITFKEGVRFKRLTPALLRILTVLHLENSKPAFAGRFQRQPDNLVVTSVNDGPHMRTSRHYDDEAVDLRTHNFPSRAARRDFRQHLAAALGFEFTVLLENEDTVDEHIHIQPRKGTIYP